MKTFEEKLKRFDAATNDEFHDDYYGWMIEAVETQESIDDFKESRDKWNEKGLFAGEGEISGLRCIVWNKCQVVKGEPRRSVSVIDFGDRRVVIDADVSFYY